MTSLQLTCRYTLFALIAIIINILCQRAILQIGKTDLIFIFALYAGTFVGLVTKYFLDKRWVFYDIETGFKKNSRKFIVYTIMGVITTIIFWGSEAAFWVIFNTDSMRELGAFIGLTIGYLIKYNLDKRFVYRSFRISEDQ